MSCVQWLCTYRTYCASALSFVRSTEGVESTSELFSHNTVECTRMNPVVFAARSALVCSKRNRGTVAGSNEFSFISVHCLSDVFSRFTHLSLSCLTSSVKP
ncbi:hypothetical protein CSUI_010043 [Cystoisospora suis]|uniref:Uncharacterized protein n=1 Tax=Cystoisospora suis TaxID=483139 RepID=A0A2C6KIC4_9APIC|nr:hypothetical protein CSUI_010043 [Cystoisospora suis]